MKALVRQNKHLLFFQTVDSVHLANDYNAFEETKRGVTENAGNPKRDSIPSCSRC